MRPRAWSSAWLRLRISAVNAFPSRRTSPIEPIAHPMPLRPRRPVHQPRLDARIVVKPRLEIRLGDLLGGERAGHIEPADLQPGMRDRGARIEPALRLMVDAVECDRPVVIGESEHRPVAPRHPPARAKRRHTRRQMRGERRREGLHGMPRKRNGE